MEAPSPHQNHCAAHAVSATVQGSPYMAMQRLESSGKAASLTSTVALRLARWHTGQSPSYTRRRLSLWGVFLVLICLCAEGQSAPPASPKQQAAREEARPPKSVKVGRVAQVAMERTVTALGSLAAYDQATVSVKVPGRLQHIAVDLGSVVQKGEVIARIETQDYQLQVEQAHAALAQARARLGLSPNHTNDRVDPERTSTVRQAQAVLEEAQAHRERTRALFEQGIISQA